MTTLSNEPPELLDECRPVQVGTREYVETRELRSEGMRGAVLNPATSTSTPFLCKDRAIGTMIRGTQPRRRTERFRGFLAFDR